MAAPESPDTDWMKAAQSAKRFLEEKGIDGLSEFLQQRYGWRVERLKETEAKAEELRGALGTSRARHEHELQAVREVVGEYLRRAIRAEAELAEASGQTPTGPAASAALAFAEHVAALGHSQVVLPGPAWSLLTAYTAARRKS